MVIKVSVYIAIPKVYLRYCYVDTYFNHYFYDLWLNFKRLWGNMPLYGSLSVPGYRVVSVMLRYHVNSGLLIFFAAMRMYQQLTEYTRNNQIKMGQIFLLPAVQV